MLTLFRKDGKGSLVVLCQSWVGSLKAEIMSPHFSGLSNVVDIFEQASYLSLLLPQFTFLNQVWLGVMYH